jgi:hypothetical protein
MYHTKSKEPLHTSNTCLFHYLHSYTWHTNESITSSHRSASKSPNTRCKVPTNQESNSLAPRNHAQKLKITDFYPFISDLWMKIAYWVHYRPAVAPHPIYRLSRPIPGRMWPVFTPPPPISSLSDWLHLRFQPDEMGHAATTVLLRRGDWRVYMWVVGQVGPFLNFWFNLNFIQQNGRDLIFFSPPMFLEFDLVFT